MVCASRLRLHFPAITPVRAVTVMLLIACSMTLSAPLAHGQSDELTRSRVPGIRVLGSTLDDAEVIREQAFRRDVESLSGPAAFVAQVADSFTSGGNVAFSAGQYLYRKFASGPIDPSFDHRAYIEEFRARISDDRLSSFMGTTNRQEADWLLSDYEDADYKQRRIDARGTLSGQVAWSIASGLAPLIALALLVCWRYYSKRPAMGFSQNKQIGALPTQDRPGR